MGGFYRRNLYSLPHPTDGFMALECFSMHWSTTGKPECFGHWCTTHFKIIITSLVKHYLGVYALCVHTKSIGNYANTTKNTKTKAHSAPTTMVIHSSNS